MNIYPYKMGSQSATNLANELNVKQIKHEGSKFKGSLEKVVINWGASKLPQEVMKCKVINSPEAVSKAADKLSSFKVMAEYGVSIPPFTESRKDALRMVEDGDTVVCRTILNGHSGEGIVLAESMEQVVDAPLYVKYIPKKQEYRVHIGNGNTLFVQRKSRRNDVAAENINWKIRNHANGFIFAQGEDLGEVPVDVTEQAHFAVRSLGLDFGAVDVIYNEKHGKAYVLEVNTAPGITGRSVEHYADYFESMRPKQRMEKKYNLADLDKAWAKVAAVAPAMPDVGLR